MYDPSFSPLCYVLLCLSNIKKKKSIYPFPSNVSQLYLPIKKIIILILNSNLGFVNITSFPSFSLLLCGSFVKFVTSATFLIFQVFLYLWQLVSVSTQVPAELSPSQRMAAALLVIHQDPLRLLKCLRGQNGNYRFQGHTIACLLDTDLFANVPFKQIYSLSNNVVSSECHSIMFF